MGTYLQTDRRLMIRSTLPEHTLLLAGFSGFEGLSEPFLFHLDLRSETHWIDPAKIVGQPLSFAVRLPDASGSSVEPRWFHGVVRRFVHYGRSERLSRYTAEVVPQDWFLTRRADARIYQGKKTADIVTDVLKRGRVQNIETSLKEKYTAREYCVQYRETDYDFFNRLLEDDGIFYYYKRAESGHTIVLGDSTTAYGPRISHDLHRRSEADQHDTGDGILSWQHGFDFRPGRWAQRDYNFTTPSNQLGTERHLSTQQPGADPYEMYAFPGGYQAKSDGERITRVRMEAEDCGYDIVTAETNCPDLTPGGRFKVGRHPVDGETGREWLVTRIEHSVREGFAFETGVTAELKYSNRIQCIPSSVVFRPARRTPRPVMHGVQTAVVVGPAGEEIYVDKYGRVKVHFHWDRHNKEDEGASCWIRVAQPWAGTSYGGLLIPRIGQEVIVDFEEGNPDRPLINGRLYNAAQEVPVSDAGGTLKASDITQAAMNTTLRSNSLGKTGGFNEITMNDRTDQEVLYIKAQKDNINIVGNDQNTVIGHNRDEAVGNNHTEVVESNYALSVGANRTTSVGDDESITIGGSKTETITETATEAVGLAKSIAVGGSMKVVVGKNNDVGIVGNSSTEIKKNENRTIEGDRTTKVGKNEAVKAGKTVVVEAGDEITLKSGSATIVLKKNGDILIKGKNIVLDASGKVDVKASGDIKMKGSKIAQN